MTFAIAEFQSIRPDFETAQENTLEWIARAHAEAEAIRSHWQREDENYSAFYQEIKERIFKLGLGSEKVQKRGVHFQDVFHQKWQEMQIYNLDRSPEGTSHYERSQFFDRAATEIFERFYPDHIPLPSQLIHVTCTGYVAPSPAQKVVSKRKGSQTLVTHAYHMGCYASIPAIRMGVGFLHTAMHPTQKVDIVHTELCTLHMNPLLHQTDQLVVQSLFGDGYIKYSIMPQEQAGSVSLIPLAIHEQLLPDSSDAMTWLVAGWGMRMSIAKEVPVLIARGLENYLKTLAQKAPIDPEKLLKEAFFAIHPGGPKVIQQIQRVLGLRSEQVLHSQNILREYGNMSSATLPHVWQALLEDPAVPDEALIVSLAFGPGLTIAGGLFEKRGAC